MNSKLFSPVSTVTPEFSSTAESQSAESQSLESHGAESQADQSHALEAPALDPRALDPQALESSSSHPSAASNTPSTEPPALGMATPLKVSEANQSGTNPSGANRAGMMPGAEMLQKRNLSENEFPKNEFPANEFPENEFQELRQIFSKELSLTAPQAKASIKAVAGRIAQEVQRICEKSDRIQKSGDIRGWQISLGRHRLEKCISYYNLGSQRGRVELHSTLSTMVYRHIAPLHTRLGFQGRHALIEDFLQGFYIESLKMFRRENDLPEDYQPKTRLQLAEYMSFTEQYAKRRVNLPGRTNQQIVILRAQSFSNRQPKETLLDIEAALEGSKRDDPEAISHSSVARQLRDHMVAEEEDPTEGVLRDRVIAQLIAYLRKEGHEDCIDYLSLRLQDLPAPEIDDILGLTARQRDYLQQRFKYHVERFAKLHQWELVHNWLGANLSQNLGMVPMLWSEFYNELDESQQRLVDWKRRQAKAPPESPISDEDIAREVGCTPKQVQKRWAKILEQAWKARNTDVG